MTAPFLKKCGDEQSFVVGGIVNNACRLSVLMTKGEKRMGKILNDDGLYLKQRRISSDVCSSSLKKLLTDEKLK